MVVVHFVTVRKPHIGNTSINFQKWRMQTIAQMHTECHSELNCVFHLRIYDGERRTTAYSFSRTWAPQQCTMPQWNFVLFALITLHVDGVPSVP
jgi:hypothetical protein